MARPRQPQEVTYDQSGSPPAACEYAKIRTWVPISRHVVQPEVRGRPQRIIEGTSSTSWISRLLAHAAVCILAAVRSNLDECDVVKEGPCGLARAPRRQVLGVSLPLYEERHLPRGRVTKLQRQR